MIRNLKIYPLFNNRGELTVKIKVSTERGSYYASIPSGASRGENEAVELPVEKVMRFFTRIRPRFMNLDENDWESADILIRRLDGTDNFSRMGENLSLALSIAIARASTNDELWKLNSPGISASFPVPVCNMMGGGSHGGGTDWQEFLVIPHLARNPSDAAKTMIEMWTEIGNELKRKKLLTGRNRENAWMSSMDDMKTLDFLSDFADDWKVRLGIDFASSELFKGKTYRYPKSGKELTPAKQVSLIEEVAEQYNLYYLEDPMEQNDFRHTRVLSEGMRKGRLVIGDDLYCTNPERVSRGAKMSATTGIIIKPNQVGTLLQASKAVEIARSNGMAIVPSHRSGETEDFWLADLAVTWDAPMIKIGMSDIPKHNRLIELWEEIPKVRMSELP